MSLDNQGCDRGFVLRSVQTWERNVLALSSCHRQSEIMCLIICLNLINLKKNTDFCRDSFGLESSSPAFSFRKSFLNRLETI